LAIGIELADHDIGRVRDNSAENTSKVTTAEGNGGLSPLSIVLLLTWKIAVDSHNDVLEGCELHHSVRDLSTPERVQTLVETGVQLAKQT